MKTESCLVEHDRRISIIENSFTWLKYLMGINITLTVLILGKLIVAGI
jgi:hypothetical protein